MKNESTKLVKKKLELKKSTIVKFGMSDDQMKAIGGGLNADVTGPTSFGIIDGGNKCVSRPPSN
jgi:hypothetical protein